MYRKPQKTAAKGGADPQNSVTETLGGPATIFINRQGQGKKRKTTLGREQQHLDI